MYAVIEVGGHQEKVQVGDVVTANRIESKQGDKLTFTPLLVVDDKAKIDLAPKSKVEAIVKGDLLGKKIRIQKFKNKTGSIVRKGHRQQLTNLEITKI